MAGSFSTSEQQNAEESCASPAQCKRWFVCLFARFIPDNSRDPFFAITPQLISQWENNNLTEAQEQVVVGEADIS